jgi:hypothetical protein
MGKIDPSALELAELSEELLKRLAADPAAAHLWRWHARPGCDDAPIGPSRRGHLASLLGLLGAAAIPVTCSSSTPATLDSGKKDLAKDAPAKDAPRVDAPRVDAPSLKVDAPRVDGPSVKVDVRVDAKKLDLSPVKDALGDGKKKKEVGVCADDPCSCGDDPCSCGDDPCSCADDPCSCADDPCP